MTATRRSSDPVLTGLLALVVGVRLLFAALLPLGQSVGPLRLEGLNDEPSHYHFVRYLVENRSLPVQRDAVDTPGAWERNELEYVQPPLYYGLCALLQPLAGQAGSHHLCRLLSLVFGLLGLWVLARTLAAAGCSRLVQHGAVVFFGLLPTHVYFCSVVSNDSLGWLVSLLLCERMVRLVREGPPQRGQRLVREALVVGLLLGLGLLVKLTLVMAIPLVMAAFLWVAWRRRDGRLVAALAVSLVVAAVLVAPWVERNLRVYGELTGVHTSSGAPRVDITQPRQFVGFVKSSLRSFWFPMQHVPGSRTAGLFAWWGGLLLAGAAGLAAWQLRRRRVSAAAGLLALHFAVVLAFYLKWNLVWPNAEGRYLFPALPFLALALLAPGADLLARAGRGRWVAPLCAAAGAWPYLYLLLA